MKRDWKHEYAKRKVHLSRTGAANEKVSPGLCFGCGKKPKTTIERVKIVDGEMVPAQVPYCGSC